MNRTAELVLGLIGAIIGVLAGLFVVFVGGALTALDGAGGADGLWLHVDGCHGASVLFSVLGLFGSVMVKSQTTFASVLMLVASVGGFICLGVLYVLPGALLLAAGIMGLVRKGGSSSSASD